MEHARDMGGSDKSIRKRATALVIDIDGTLLRGNFFLEGLIKVIAATPVSVFIILPRLLTNGRVWVKCYVAERVQINVMTLPLSKGILNLINEKKKQEASILLASGSNERLANELGRFIGTDKGDKERGLTNFRHQAL